jgi:hypothetical protein
MQAEKGIHQCGEQLDRVNPTEGDALKPGLFGLSEHSSGFRRIVTASLCR